jgi:hypothetical protein
MEIMQSYRPGSTSQTKIKRGYQMKDKTEKKDKTESKGFNLKPAVETTKTLIIFVAIGFVAGWFVHSNYATQTQAQIEKTTTQILKSVPVSQAAVAPKE